MLGKLLTYISIICFAALFLAPDIMHIALFPVIIIILCVINKIFKINPDSYKETGIFEVLLSLIISLFLSIKMADRFLLPVPSAFVIGLISIFEMLNILRAVTKKFDSSFIVNSEVENKLSISEIIIAFVSAVVAITLLSKSSFLYPFNDWADSNSFFTHGKAIGSGKVLYRDLFEHKGPYIFFIHYIASLISYKSFLGVYFVEVIAATAYAVLTYKISIEITGARYYFIIPVICSMTYSSYAFLHGDSVEELCLPLMAYVLLASIQMVKSSEVSKKVTILSGISLGLIFWMKYTLIGFFVGIFLYFAVIYILRKTYKNIVMYIEYLSAGFVISTIPVVIYFSVNKALNSLWECYFYDNIFLYSNPSSGLSGFLRSLYRGIGRALKENTLLFVVLVIGLILMQLIKNKRKLNVIYCSMSSMILFTYMAYISYFYYSLIMYLWLVIALSGIELLFKKIIKKPVKFSPIIIAVIVLFLTMPVAVFMSPNRYMLLEKRDNLPQYKFEKVISQVDNPRVMNYQCMDHGFLTVAGIVPDAYHYCKLNVPLENMKQSQLDYINDQKPEFVITRDAAFEDGNYLPILEESYFSEDKDHTFTLYGRNDLEIVGENIKAKN